MGADVRGGVQRSRVLSVHAIRLRNLADRGICPARLIAESSLFTPPALVDRVPSDWRSNCPRREAAIPDVDLGFGVGDLFAARFLRLLTVQEVETADEEDGDEHADQDIPSIPLFRKHVGDVARVSWPCRRKSPRLRTTASLIALKRS